MLFHKGSVKAVMHQNHFQTSMHYALDRWPFDPKSLSGVFVWRFMMIGVKEKQLRNIKYFQFSMDCDLLTLKSIWHMFDSLGAFV